MFDISIELSTRKKQSEKVKNNIIVFIVIIIGFEPQSSLNLL